MAKKKINTLRGKRLVTGDPNLITMNEIHVKDTSKGVEVTERDKNGKLVNVTMPTGGGDTPSVSDEQVIKYYKINFNYNGVNYSDKWKELLVPFVERVEHISNNDAFIRTCLYSGSITSNYGNTFYGIVTGSGGNLVPLYVSDAWFTVQDPNSEISVYSLLFFLQNNTIDGIPNLLDCVTEVSQKEFFNCAIY